MIYDNPRGGKGLMNLMGAKNVLCDSNTFIANGSLSYLAVLFASDVSGAAGHESIFVNNTFDINDKLDKALLRGGFPFKNNVVRLNGEVTGSALFSFAGNLEGSTTPKTNRLYALPGDVDITGNKVFAKTTLPKGMSALSIFDASFEGHTLNLTDNQLWTEVDQAAGEWPLVNVQDVQGETPIVNATGTKSNLFNMLSFYRTRETDSSYENYHGTLVDPKVLFGGQEFTAQNDLRWKQPLNTEGYDAADPDAQAPAATCAVEGHDWSEWAVRVPATPTEDGLKERTCSRCGETEEEAIPATGLYYELEGDGSVWAPGADGAQGEAPSQGGDASQDNAPALSFRFKRVTDDEQTFGHFTGIQVDGLDVDSSNYDAVAGSVVITLHPDYLATLPAGNHELRALFDDGNDPTAAFTVQARQDAGTTEPDTRTDTSEEQPANTDKPTGDSPAEQPAVTDKPTGDVSAEQPNATDTSASNTTAEQPTERDASTGASQETATDGSSSSSTGSPDSSVSGGSAANDSGSDSDSSSVSNSKSERKGGSGKDTASTSDSARADKPAAHDSARADTVPDTGDRIGSTSILPLALTLACAAALALLAQKHRQDSPSQ